MSQITMKDILATRMILVERFPRAFFAKGVAKTPLKVGIHRDLIAACPDIAPRLLKAVLSNYVGHPLYLQSMKKGADRVDLDGTLREPVTASDALDAIARLARLDKPVMRTALEVIAAFPIEDPANLDALAIKGIAATALAKRKAPEVSRGNV